jgi:hypothetical protein
MPFTFAHPAAVLPIVRSLGRYAVLSALVIGSISPDFAYIIPISFSRYQSHSVAGLFLFCMPVSLIAYVVFHKFLKGPLLSLAPPSLFRRLGEFVKGYSSLPSANWLSILLCIFFGAITHLFWDTFTHRGAIGVKMLPFLQETAFYIGSYPVYIYKLLQHGSTIIGLGVITWFFLRWMRTATVRPHALPFTLSGTQQTIAIAAITLIPVISGVFVGITHITKLGFLFGLQNFVGHVVFTALPMFTIMVILYSSWWHFHRWRIRGI